MADLIKDLIKAIDEPIDRFNGAIPAIQQKVLDRIAVLLNRMELVKGGRVKPNLKNLELIKQIKAELQGVFRDAGYTKEVEAYMQAFDNVTKVQNNYFTEIVKKFTPPVAVGEIQRQSIENTVASLTGAGINTNVINKIANLLRQNISTGAKYTDLLNQLRDHITGGGKGMGSLMRYTKQMTTDALNQYSSEYSQAIAADLGLEWFQYTGALIATSRTLCEALVKKRYIHISEIPDIIKGNFKEFQDMDGVIDSKTDLPSGMIPGTNAANFTILRGGYNCGHKMQPTSAAAVPVSFIMLIPRNKLGQDSLIRIRAAA